MKNSIIWIAIVLIVIVGLVYFLSPNQGSNTQGGAQSNVQAPTIYTLNVATDPTLGSYLTAANGMTLYTFANDKPGVSNCSGNCAVTWPPYAGSALNITGMGVGGTVATITRADGTMQVTYNGSPLYFWKSDMKPGDTTGNGVGGVWSVAKP